MTSPGEAAQPDRRLSLAERLNIVYDRLRDAPAPTSANEALAQLSSTLDSVEDEYSGVPRDPNPGLKFDGRMYPPRDDFIERREDGTLVATTKGNTITLGPGGDTVITRRGTDEVVFERPGAETERAQQAEAEAEVDTERSADPGQRDPLAGLDERVRDGIAEAKGAAQPDSPTRSADRGRNRERDTDREAGD